MRKTLIPLLGALVLVSCVEDDGSEEVSLPTTVEVMDTFFDLRLEGGDGLWDPLHTFAFLNDGSARIEGELVGGSSDTGNWSYDEATGRFLVDANEVAFDVQIRASGKITGSGSYLNRIGPIPGFEGVATLEENDPWVWGSMPAPGSCDGTGILLMLISDSQGTGATWIRVVGIR